MNKRRIFLIETIAISLSILINYILFRYIDNKFKYLDTIDSKIIKATFIAPIEKFRPENVEKIKYCIFLLSFPVLIFIFYLILKKINEKYFDNKNVNIIFYFLNSLILILSFTLVYEDLKSVKYFYLSNNYIYYNPIKYFTIFILLTVSIFFIYFKFKKVNSASILLKIVYYFAIFSIILLVFTISILDIHMFDYINGIEFNACFYSVQRVFSGDYLLVNFINQYGLYPHFLKPIFKLIGLNIFSYSLIMGSILCLSYINIFIFLNIFLKNKGIVLFGFINIVFYHYIFMRFFTTTDLYYQYFPVRLVFPTILILLSYLYFISKDSKYKKIIYYVSCIAYSLSILWNFDSGVVVFITWILALIYNELFNDEIVTVLKNSMFHLLKVAVTFCGVIFIYMMIIRIQSGYFPDFNNYLNYQKYFYGSGFMMIAMKAIHPWNIVILGYILGLSYSIKCLVFKENSINTKVIFILSILGFGLFSYYQGRSHDYNLLSVCYPVLIILVIFLNDIFEKLKNFEFKFEYIVNTFIFIVLMYFVTASSVSIIENYDKLKNIITSKFTQAFDRIPNAITENTTFMKNLISQEDKILILSYNDGIYYMGTGKKEELVVPGFSEILLKSDHAKICNYIKNGNYDKIFIEESFVVDSNEDIIDELGNDCSLLASNDKWGMKCYIKNTQINKTNRLFNYDSNTVFYERYDLKSDTFKNNNDNVISIFNQAINKNKIILDDNFTIQMIVKPYENQVENADILSNHPGTKGYQGFAIEKDGKNDDYAFGYGNGTKWMPNLKFKLNVDKINYLVLMCKSNIVYGYLDGELVGEVNAQERIMNSDYPLSTKNWISGDRYFNGIVYEIKISNEIISKDKIAESWLEISDEYNIK